jgi:hypothetical protein
LAKKRKVKLIDEFLDQYNKKWFFSNPNFSLRRICLDNWLH